MRGLKLRRKARLVILVAVISVALTSVTVFFLLPKNQDAVFQFALEYELHAKGVEKTGQTKYLNDGDLIRERFWSGPMTDQSSKELAQSLLKACPGCTLAEEIDGDWVLRMTTTRFKEYVEVRMQKKIPQDTLYKGQPEAAVVDVITSKWQPAGLWQRLAWRLGL